MTLEQKLLLLLSSLEKVEVRGKENMKILAGCIEYVESMINDIRKEGAENGDSVNRSRIASDS